MGIILYSFADEDRVTNFMDEDTKHREFRQLALDHTAGEQQNEDLNQAV